MSFIVIIGYLLILYYIFNEIHMLTKPIATKFDLSINAHYLVYNDKNAENYTIFHLNF